MSPNNCSNEFDETKKTEEDPAAAPPTSDCDTPRPKRNCGRCGPTSEAGRRRSAMNSLKHGACARTLVLPVESHEGWEILLGRWLNRYQPCEESLEYDFVLRTAQAEWHRLRCVRQYDDFILTTCGKHITDWTPEQLKMHDLLLRYKNGAERSFHRENRALDAHYKVHNLFPKPEDEKKKAKEEKEDKPGSPNRPWPDFEIYEASHEEVAEIIRQRNTPPPGHPLYQPPDKK